MLSEHTTKVEMRDARMWKFCEHELHEIHALKEKTVSWSLHSTNL